MTEIAPSSRPLYRPKNPIRFITAASLFDGHDAAINIMRRLLQSQGAEVIHLGHNRSVDEVVSAAIEEDVQGVAISSYQGGHIEYFKYLVDRLREEGRSDIKIFGGGGGVIIKDEIAELEAYGVDKIFSPEDGQILGLEKMINLLIEPCDVDLSIDQPFTIEDLALGKTVSLARIITAIEAGKLADNLKSEIATLAHSKVVPVVGITGTGGAGKSSITDELIRRFRLDQQDKLRIAVLAVDPTRRRGGGALLGDRIRMNSIDSPQVYFRSFATRGSSSEIPPPIPSVLEACRAFGFDIIIVETPGIGQGNADIVDIADVSLYVMTPEFGAASQLEKIDMLDLADLVAINKFDRRGADDALRLVERQWARNHFGQIGEKSELPIFGTIASRFNDNGTTALYQYLRDSLVEHGLSVQPPVLAPAQSRTSTSSSPIVPSDRVRYLAEIGDTVRRYHEATQKQVESVRRWTQVNSTLRLLQEVSANSPSEPLAQLEEKLEKSVSPESRALLENFEQARTIYSQDELITSTNGVDRTTPLRRSSMSGTLISRVALPRFTDPAELLRWLRAENLPGYFPFTAGVFPLKRDNEDPARMFAGEGDPMRTNRRFHLLSQGQPATRLSTAFDSVTLYGRDPATPPDIYGKIGTSGVSIARMSSLPRQMELTEPLHFADRPCREL